MNRDQSREVVLDQHMPYRIRVFLEFQAMSRSK
jgi:hypothetical protein